MSRTISILSHISGSCMVVKWVRSLRNVFRSFELVLIERSDGVSVPLSWMRFCSAETKFYKRERETERDQVRFVVALWGGAVAHLLLTWEMMSPRAVRT